MSFIQQHTTAKKSFVTDSNEFWKGRLRWKQNRTEPNVHPTLFGSLKTNLEYMLEGKRWLIKPRNPGVRAAIVLYLLRKYPPLPDSMTDKDLLYAQQMCALLLTKGYQYPRFILRVLRFINAHIERKGIDERHPEVL